ncbi:MAG TPA: glycosyltransferase family 39 protein, partial [Planctomycetota bacterium]|nr:glycosyltransferase family 39 protein [Planctomycetota bacterium]
MSAASAATSPAGGRRGALVALGVVLVVAAWLRIEALDRGVFAHPENYAPGFDDPSWVTAPYPRRTTLEGVLRGNLADGHPPLWFVAMLPWVRAFGTGLTALRLPSALAGTATVALLFLFVRRRSPAWIAALAAALLALHGAHVFWSRLARMYAAATLLGAAASWLLLRLLDGGRRRDAVAYVLAAAALAWTQIYGFA